MENVIPMEAENGSQMEDDKGGVIVLIYATPREVHVKLQERDLWGYVYQQYYKRMCWTRFVRRAVKPKENKSDWLCDRDLGVVFVELDGVPFETEWGMRKRCAHGFPYQRQKDDFALGWREPPAGDG